MKVIFFLFLCIAFACNCFGQQTTAGDGAVLRAHINNVQAADAAAGQGWKIKMQVSYNPIKLILFVPLFIYQKLLSEQVSAICEFEPSCSNFGVQSIKQLGFIKGLFLTADRLSRCNGEAQPETQYYLIDHYTGKVIDEPAMYKIKD